jgi:exonuclease VII small subunit
VNEDKQLNLPGEEQDYYEEYFLKIEALFAALRGRSILLSPADYQLARTWYDRGIPLSCALRGIRAAFFHKMSEGDIVEDEILSLNWCRWAVMKEWKEYKSVSLQDDSAAQFSAPERTGDEIDSILDSLIFDLNLKKIVQNIGEGVSQQLLISLREILQRLEEARNAWQSGTATADELEEQLQSIDDSMMKAVWEHMDESKRKKINTSINKKLKKHEARLSEEATKQTRETARMSMLRHQLRLPRITLYSLQV